MVCCWRVFPSNGRRFQKSHPCIWKQANIRKPNLPVSRRLVSLFFQPASARAVALICGTNFAPVNPHLQPRSRHPPNDGWHHPLTNRGGRWHVHSSSVSSERHADRGQWRYLRTAWICPRSTAVNAGCRRQTLCYEHTSPYVVIIFFTCTNHTVYYYLCILICHIKIFVLISESTLKRYSRN